MPPRLSKTLRFHKEKVLIGNELRFQFCRQGFDPCFIARWQCRYTSNFLLDKPLMPGRIGYNALPVTIVIVLQRTRKLTAGSYGIFYHRVRVRNKYPNQRSYGMHRFRTQLILTANFFMNVKHCSINAHLSNVNAAVWIAPPSKFYRIK